jgi:hypothetical protein
MIGASGGVQLGHAKVYSVDGRGFTPEELLPQYMDKMMSVSDNAAPHVREQAHAFKQRIAGLMLAYGKAVEQNHATTVATKLEGAGHPDIAKYVRSM